MKKLIIFTFICYLTSYNYVQSQNKQEYEKNGVKVRFTTTQLGIIENNKFELIRDMKLKGVFVFIKDNNSIVLRHNNGQDELLKVIEVKKTDGGSYVFQCDKQRVLFVSISEKTVMYSIEGNSSLFVFPIDSDDISKLKSVLQKF